jgi:hypothetical protein
MNPVLKCSGNAVRVYFALQEDPSLTVAELARELCLGRSSVQRFLKELEDGGFIKRLRRTTDIGTDMPSRIDVNRDTSVSPVIHLDNTKRGSMSNCVPICQCPNSETLPCLYAIDLSTIDPSLELLRNSKSGRISSDVDNKELTMGYEFFEQATPDESTVSTNDLRRKAAATSTPTRALRTQRPLESWTSLDLAQHWRQAAMARYPMKAASVGSVQNLSPIFSARLANYHETPAMIVEMIDRFLSDSRNVAKVKRDIVMWKLFLAYANVHSASVRDFIDGAEERARIASIEASTASTEAPRPISDEYARAMRELNAG